MNAIVSKLDDAGEVWIVKAKFVKQLEAVQMTAEKKWKLNYDKLPGMQ